MQKNIELLREVISFILDNPDMWDQSGWAQRYEGDGLTMCVAGITASLAGYHFDWLENTEDRLQFAVYTTTGKPIESLARDLLGLDDDEAIALFLNVDNNFDDLFSVIEEITDNEIMKGQYGKYGKYRRQNRVGMSVS